LKSFQSDFNSFFGERLTKSRPSPVLKRQSNLLSMP